jgi:uncharacterized protein YecT (DUF1311 family)
VRLPAACLVAVGILLAAGCGSETPPPPPKPKPKPGLPRIVERFTLSPCPHGKAAETTIGIEACSNQRLHRTDIKIVAQEHAIYSLLSAKARAAFASGERGWLAYRDGLCVARASKYEGGTALPVEFGACEEEISSSHLRALAATQRLLRQH